jgi:hypothetical protein
VRGGSVQCRGGRRDRGDRGLLGARPGRGAGPSRTAGGRDPVHGDRARLCGPGRRRSAAPLRRSRTAVTRSHPAHRRPDTGTSSPARSPGRPAPECRRSRRCLLPTAAGGAVSTTSWCGGSRSRTTSHGHAAAGSGRSRRRTDLPGHGPAARPPVLRRPGRRIRHRSRDSSAASGPAPARRCAAGDAWAVPWWRWGSHARGTRGGRARPALPGPSGCGAQPSRSGRPRSTLQ